MKIGTSDLTKLYLGSAEVDKVYLGTDLVYVSHDYSQDYLTFVALENGTFQFTNPLEYSIDDGQTWTALASDTDSPTVTAGNKILWKATGLTPSYSSGGGTFSSTGRFEVEGNVMTLRDGVTGDTVLSDYQFRNLFDGATGLTSAENLVLPSPTLSVHCYSGMFQGCTSLTTAPELPSTTLNSFCYASMFNGCTSLATAPELPATTVVWGCYSNMFNGCTSLATAPELPATTLDDSCYDGMFYRCTSLTTAPELPATTLAYACYISMFQGCTSLTTAPELPSTTLTGSCYTSMFNGCSSLTTAPELPATAVLQGCYAEMFYDCPSLTSITCLATDISATSCLDNWVSGVAATGTFVKAAGMANWPTGTSGIPSGWTVKDYGTLPDVPFLFNYNAKEYDATTYTLPQTDGQLIEQDAVIAGDYLSEITHNTDHITLPYRVQRAVIKSQLLVRDSSNPTLTIITKAKTTGGHSVFANRASNYNYMYRQYTDYLTLHGVSEQGRIAVDSTKPSVLSVRVDSNRTLTYNNWTDSTSSIKSGTFDYAGANSTAALFNGYASRWSEEWSGDFYWIYLSTETLTDEQIQQVIDYNENL